ncbi:protein FAR1-RELATED SEQUENCE 5-like [Salvia splendens]|uniref:protein FAR1-RELATED SEQUENCE 5-like n=1 Tax=Salvia splendens TaxID=180675 RepID=UPI001C271A73|nr:protein FAR1-RELATED SEQUENCE 5-like [Salvia splendens]
MTLLGIQDLNTLECPIELKPFVSRSFPTLDNAIEFYENYGRRVGFDTRKNGSKKVDDITIWFYMVCNREGEQKFSDQQPKRRRKSKKCGCNARVAFKFDSDRGCVIQHLNIVSFDTTYSTNRYSMIFAPFTGKDNHGRALSFGADLGMKVAVEKFLVNTRHRWCMWHIMAKVAEKTSGRLLWRHELESAEWFVSMFESRKFWVPAYFRDFPNSSLIKATSVSESQNSFFKRYTQFRAILVVFLMNFNNVVDAQLNHSAKLDYMDSNTTAKMKTEWSLEKHGSTIFIDGAFKEIQEQILEAYNHCSLVSISNDSSPEVYKVLDHFSNTWTVIFSVEDSVCHCGCKMFSRTGLVCCHIFLVLKNKTIRLIPENLIGGRWLKSPLVKVVHAVQCQDVATRVYFDEKKKAQATLLGEMLGLYQAVSVDIDQIHKLTSIVRGAR